MARDFDNASTEKIVSSTVAVVDDTPLAMGCLFNHQEVPTDADGQIMLAIAGTSGSHDYWFLSSGDTNLRFACNIAGGSTFYADSTKPTQNTWHHAMGIAASNTDRRCWLDGGGKGTSTDTTTQGDSNTTGIGVLQRTGTLRPWDGLIAEVGIWDLSGWPGATDADKATAFENAALPALANRYSPLFFPLGLVFYAPLVREVLDPVGALALTTSGTTVADHPRVIYPSMRSVITLTPAAVVVVPDESHPATLQLTNSGGMVGTINI